MAGLLATLPVQLACQLITPADQSIENFTPNQPFFQRPVVVPNGYTAFPDIGVAMKYYSTSLTWNLARKHCILEGGDLAVIDSFKKAEYANTLRGTNPRGAFLGIHKLFDNVEWVSVKTSLPMAFIPWRVGLDPNAAAPSCTALYGELGGRVGTFDCNKAWSHTCEVPLWQECRIGIPSQTQTNKPATNENLQHTDESDIKPN